MPMSDVQRVCSFLVEDLLFGVDVAHVQEVVRQHALTPIPLAPPAIRGLMNLRGSIVAAIDLRERLGFGPDSGNGTRANVILRSEHDSVSLLVDEIGDVLEVSAQQFERPPDTLRGRARQLIVGAYKLPDRLLLVLDVEKTINVSSEATEVGRPTGRDAGPAEVVE